MSAKVSMVSLVMALCSCLGLSAQEANDDLIEANLPDACRAVAEGSLFKPLQDIVTEIPSDDRRLPPDCTSEFFERAAANPGPRFQTITPVHWQATDFFHRPAYFDDVPLERYGHTLRHPRLQPFVSGARFVLTIPVLPYKMGIDRPRACISTLGHQPPGNCVPCMKQTLPKEADAAFFEAAAAVGLVFLLP